MQSSVSLKIRKMRKEDGRKLVSGLTAVKTGAGTNPWMETPEGVLILPADRAAGGAGLKDSSARHLPEFFPADPEEAFRMARSAALYADTYRTPILVRLNYEVRFGMAEIGPVRPGKAEMRRSDYSHAAASCGLPEAFSDSAWNRVSGSGRRGIIVRGPAALKLQEILNGYPSGRILRLGTPWPFPEERARDFLAGLSEVLVLDEERDRLLNAVYAVKGKYDLRIKVIPFYGEESSERDLRESLVRFFGKDAEEQILRIGTPSERSLFGMPMLPPVLQPERKACGLGGG